MLVEAAVTLIFLSDTQLDTLKGQITNYKPAIQITSISIKSDSIPLSGEFGHIVRVVGVPFLALNCDRCTADKSAVYIKCRPHKCLHLTIIMICI